MQEYESVKLLYPNDFRKNIYKSFKIKIPFNWFLCSNRYVDEKNNRDMCEISKFARFFCEKSGRVLAISNIVHLVILSDISQLKSITNGFVIYLGDLTNPYDEVCHDVIFFMKKGILKEIDFQKNKIITFSKQKNRYLRNKIKEFPDCDEINRLSYGEKYSNATKKLYEIIKEYLYSSWL